MHKTLCALAAALSLTAAAPVFAAPAPYTVAVTTEAGPDGATHVDISFATIKIFSSMCGRETIAVDLRVPAARVGLGIPTPALGLIDFKTKLDPQAICLQAFGPHRGGLSLALGERLPALGNGYYRLAIDGVDYGYVVVADGQAALLSQGELPQ